MRHLAQMKEKYLSRMHTARCVLKKKQHLVLLSESQESIIKLLDKDSFGRG